LVEIVECNDGIVEHEDCFGDPKRVFQGSFSFGFKVFDAVVRYVSDCTA
jgi:hypothetical protein